MHQVDAQLNVVILHSWKKTDLSLTSENKYFWSLWIIQAHANHPNISPDIQGSQGLEPDHFRKTYHLACITYVQTLLPKKRENKKNLAIIQTCRWMPNVQDAYLPLNLHIFCHTILTMVTDPNQMIVTSAYAIGQAHSRNSPE